MRKCLRLFCDPNCPDALSPVSCSLLKTGEALELRRWWWIDCCCCGCPRLREDGGRWRVRLADGVDSLAEVAEAVAAEATAAEAVTVAAAVAAAIASWLRLPRMPTMPWLPLLSTSAATEEPRVSSSVASEESAAVSIMGHEGREETATLQRGGGEGTNSIPLLLITLGNKGWGGEGERAIKLKLPPSSIFTGDICTPFLPPPPTHPHMQSTKLKLIFTAMERGPSRE